jgi:hypothetical protein
MLADYGAGSPGSPLTSGPTESRANVYLLDGEEMYHYSQTVAMGATVARFCFRFCSNASILRVRASI